MKKLFLTGIAAQFLATGTAHAMQADISKTWCARQGAKITGTPQDYWGFIEKCHKRRGTQPIWYPACTNDVPPCKCANCDAVPVPRRDPRNGGGEAMQLSVRRNRLPTSNELAVGSLDIQGDFGESDVVRLGIKHRPLTLRAPRGVPAARRCDRLFS